MSPSSVFTSKEGSYAAEGHTAHLSAVAFIQYCIPEDLKKIHQKEICFIIREYHILGCVLCG